MIKIVLNSAFPMSVIIGISMSLALRNSFKGILIGAFIFVVINISKKLMANNSKK